jgi:hypothetical protein
MVPSQALSPGKKNPLFPQRKRGWIEPFLL